MVLYLNGYVELINFQFHKTLTFLQSFVKWLPGSKSQPRQKLAPHQ